MPSNLRIMGKLHKIINLRTRPDHRGPELGPVDAGTRTDLDVILDDHATDVRHLVVPALGEVETQTVTPQ